LLHVLAGLEPVDEGSIELAGVRLDGLSAAALAWLRRRHVGLVFQFFDLIEHLTALVNVTLAALVGGARRQAALERARDLLDRLGMLERAGELPELFRSLNARGQTILMITHSAEVAEGASRIVRMRDGLIEAPATAGRP
jgi:putative ABC transport system ATP-binding protein